MSNRTIAEYIRNSRRIVPSNLNPVYRDYDGCRKRKKPVSTRRKILTGRLTTSRRLQFTELKGDQPERHLGPRERDAVEQMNAPLLDVHILSSEASCCIEGCNIFVKI
jgi:hypothetical protein